MDVSEGVAIYFKEQLVGETNGHMAAIPNNPVLQGLLMAHDAGDSDAKLAIFLRECADWIDGGGNA